MASVFDTIKRNAGDLDRSNSWYRSQVNRIASGTTAQQLFRQGKLARRPSVGRLNLFGYNPKLRKTLPYYDVFPLVLPLEAISGGFIGMNFHYLPPLLRTRLFKSASDKSAPISVPPSISKALSATLPAVVI